MRFLNKRGVELLNNAIIFIVLNLLFFAGMIYFVGYSAIGINMTEKIYARQIALLIDEAKPGTSIEIDISQLYDLADKESVDRLKVVEINNDENKVFVSVRQGKGHSYDFFSSNSVIWDLGKKSGKLNLEIVK